MWVPEPCLPESEGLLWQEECEGTEGAAEDRGTRQDCEEGVRTSNTDPGDYLVRGARPSVDLAGRTDLLGSRDCDGEGGLAGSRPERGEEREGHDLLVLGLGDYGELQVAGETGVNSWQSTYLCGGSLGPGSRIATTVVAECLESMAGPGCRYSVRHSNSGAADYLGTGGD